MPAQIDVLLSTLNATEVGTLDSIAAKLREVKDQLERMEQHDLAAKLPAKAQELAAAWQRQTDAFIELAKKTLGEQPQPKAKAKAK